MFLSSGVICFQEATLPAKWMATKHLHPRPGGGSGGGRQQKEKEVLLQQDSPQAAEISAELFGRNQRLFGD